MGVNYHVEFAIHNGIESGVTKVFLTESFSMLGHAAPFAWNREVVDDLS